MSGVDPALEAILAEARREFAAALPARIDEVKDLVHHGAWDEARRAAHKLRGSSATYGLTEVGEIMGEIEEVLIASLPSPGAGAQAQVASLLARARAAANGGTP